MRIFGEIPGYEDGTSFNSRKELAQAGIHPPLQAGISGSADEGADSIILSGGYEDDEDSGIEIIYTGSGGRDSKTGRQIADQELTRGNLALAKSKIEGFPIRVTRSSKHKSSYSPKIGYEYAGLYVIEDYWKEKGKSGFYVWRYRLKAYQSNPLSPRAQSSSITYAAPKRKAQIIQRIVRDTGKAKAVKEWHNFECQVCGIAIPTSAGLYAEAAHIKPLGAPHNGPDVEGNILCLCPNHHVMFDNGGFMIADDLSLIKIEGQLRTIGQHCIELDFIQYHREHYQN